MTLWGLPGYRRLTVCQLCIAGMVSASCLSASMPSFGATTAEIRKENTPSIVRLRATGEDPNGKPRSRSTGGIGFFISKHGHMLTARHVVGLDESWEREEETGRVVGRKVQVTGHNEAGGVGRRLSEGTRNVRTSPYADLALVKIKERPKGWPTIVEVDTCEPTGPIVVLVWRDASSVTETVPGSIETDAEEYTGGLVKFNISSGEIQEGDSGSPVFSQDGKLIGVLQGVDKLNQRYGFFVPIADAAGLLFNVFDIKPCWEQTMSENLPFEENIASQGDWIISASLNFLSVEFPGERAIQYHLQQAFVYTNETDRDLARIVSTDYRPGDADVRTFTVSGRRMKKEAFLTAVEGLRTNDALDISEQVAITRKSIEALGQSGSFIGEVRYERGEQAKVLAEVFQTGDVEIVANGTSIRVGTAREKFARGEHVAVIVEWVIRKEFGETRRMMADGVGQLTLFPLRRLVMAVQSTNDGWEIGEGTVRATYESKQGDVEGVPSESRPVLRDGKLFFEGSVIEEGTRVELNWVWKHSA